jgi:AcrR family transcriptional regulator
MVKSSGRRRGDLDKDEILAAALRVVDEGGIEALTMRRVAGALGVAPMSLYKHVDTREEIVAGLLDRALQAIDVEANAALPWDDQLRQILSSAHATFVEHPGLLQVMMLQPISAAAGMRAVERILAILRTAGFDGGDAVEVVAALHSYTFGFSVQQRVRTASTTRAHRENLRRLPAADFPNVRELAADFSDWASDAQFASGLDLLLKGAADRLRTIA